VDQSPRIRKVVWGETEKLLLELLAWIGKAKMNISKIRASSEKITKFFVVLH